MRFTDAHHHFWDLGHCHYPWLMARGVRRFFGDPGPIRRNYLPEDLLAESERWRPERTVHIQVGVAREDCLEESRWLQSLADKGDTGIPNAIVAFVDLSASNAADQIQAQAAIPNVRGVRHIVGRHEDEDRRNHAPDLLADPVWVSNLGLLAAAGLSFDLQLIPSQYERALDVLSKTPDLRVAICHCGSPWDQTREGLSSWLKAMHRFAELPQVNCKISGLGMFNHNWKIPDIEPLVSGVLEAFGVNRVMFGSNFPVDTLYGSYDRIWDAYDQLTSGLEPADREALFRGTAERFYRLGEGVS